MDKDALGPVTKRMFARLWKEVLEYHLNEFRYMASAADLGTSFSILYDGFLVQFNGFDDSMPNYITETFSRMVAMRTVELSQVFDEKKEELLKEWKNSYYD